MIAANQTSTMIAIQTMNDNIAESDETFKIELSDLTPSEAVFTNSTATGTILANDPKISIANTTSEEGSTLIFTVTSNQAIAEPIIFSYNVSFDAPATATASDLSGTTTGTGMIAANQTSTYDCNSNYERYYSRIRRNFHFTTYQS